VDQPAYIQEMGKKRKSWRSHTRGRQNSVFPISGGGVIKGKKECGEEKAKKYNMSSNLSITQ